MSGATMLTVAVPESIARTGTTALPSVPIMMPAGTSTTPGLLTVKPIATGDGGGGATWTVTFADAPAVRLTSGGFAGIVTVSYTRTSTMLVWLPREGGSVTTIFATPALVPRTSTSICDEPAGIVTTAGTLTSDAASAWKVTCSGAATGFTKSIVILLVAPFSIFNCSGET